MNRVLVLENDPGTRLYHEELLGQFFTVHSAVSIRQAKEKIISHGPFAVIITDLVLPDGEGLDFLASLNLINPGAVKIVLTSNPTYDKAVEAGNRCGVFKFLDKQIPPGSLVSSVRAALDQHQTMTHPPHRQEILTNEELSFLSKGPALPKTVAVGEAEADSTSWPYFKGKGERTAVSSFSAPFFSLTFSKMLAQAKRSNIPLSVINLEVIPRPGNRPRKQLATLSRKLMDRISKRLRASDTMHKVRENEYAILLWNVSKQGVEKVALDITALFEEVNDDMEAPQLGVRMGISLYPQHGQEAGTLLHMASTAKRGAEKMPTRPFRTFAA